MLMMLLMLIVVLVLTAHEERTVADHLCTGINSIHHERVVLL